MITSGVKVARLHMESSSIDEKYENTRITGGERRVSSCKFKFVRLHVGERGIFESGILALPRRHTYGLNDKSPRKLLCVASQRISACAGLCG